MSNALRELQLDLIGFARRGRRSEEIEGLQDGIGLFPLGWRIAEGGIVNRRVESG